MYSKIALKNVKRSFKDYTIYFLTLTFAVCIFYSFNSIGSQQAMLKLNKDQSEYIKVMESVIGYISIFVSVVLGGLIMYANNFLVKRRKKELGIYMVLGMGKNKISKILFLETFLIGSISLIVGLGLGIVLSQGLSVFTAKLFEVGMNEYKFLVSVKAIQKSILYFGLIFLLVMIFNTVIISKYKLIHLLNAAKKNEKFQIKNSIFLFIIFILGIVSLVVAYYLINKTLLNPEDKRTLISIILGCLGTFLFFFGFSGFIINIVKNNKKVYFKDLNIFITRQISSKINTNFISMTVICLMLFLTIGILSTGVSFKNVLEEGLKETLPFDATITVYGEKTPRFVLDRMRLKNTNSEKYVYYTQYKLKSDYKNLLYKYVDPQIKKQFNMIKYTDIDAIKISEYNKIRELSGKKPIELKDNEVLVTANFKILISTVEKFLESENAIKIDNKIYNIKNKKLITDCTANKGIADNMFTIIVNDKFLKEKEISKSYININYIGSNKERSEKKLVYIFENFKNDKELNDVKIRTRKEVYENMKTSTTLIVYIAIYLGIIFLISSAAVLAIQQLSEASDSIERYNILKKIGVSRKMINKSIFTQVLIYFFTPLILAIIHSIIGINVVNKTLKLYGDLNIGTTALITSFILIIIYGGYFCITYTGYKNIVK